ncbi:glycosyltransferase family 4 protein [Thermococcus sibiricus]|uniref:Glycosyl transferase, group 1 n=1 Tax=Thermococcus sibiricus TaxID=172049 RepID=A0A101EM73_9EURY|nr:glycosyltransferase family 4 protein [Thermococcus sibiricus]KUK17747.1 MAG: Glycosyl transferase, group 1 [Thermococcus sibiricus]
MKVIITATDNPYQVRVGGKHVHQLLLEKGLSRLGVDVSTIYPNIEPEPAAKRYIKYVLSILRSFDFSSIYKDRVWQILTQLKSLYTSHQDEIANADVIHFHDVLALYSFIESNPSNSTPRILTLHGYFAREFLDYNRIPRVARNKVYNFALEIERGAIPNSDFIIAVDSRIKSYVLTSFDYPKNKICTLPNAIDTETFKPVSMDEQKLLKKQLRFAPNDFLILVPRRLVPKNGVIYAVKAMKYIKNENIKLIIAGDGIERRNIEKEIRKEGLGKKVLLIGSVPHSEIHKYFKAVDVVLIPSITSHGVQEATSLAALEGMSCGKPVIVTNVGGLKEIVTNRRTGIIVPEKDPEAIATAIETILENPDVATIIGSNAREYVLKHHSYISYASRVLDIYKKVISR